MVKKEASITNSLVQEMKKILSLFVFATLAGATHAQTQAQDIEYLTKLKTTLWPRAYQNSDVELLDTILHEQFKLVDNDGKQINKQDELTYLAGFKWPHSDFVYTIETIEIIHNNTAVIVGTGEAKGENSKGEYCYTYTSSNVLVREGETWRAVLSHVSGYQANCNSK